MTIAAPYALAAGPIAQWSVVDRETPVRTSKPAAGGIVTVTLDPLDFEEQWLIDRAVVSSTSTTATRCRLYDTTVDPLRLLSGTDTGNYDEADYPAGLFLAPGAQLVAQWTGCSDGATATLRLQTRILRRAS